MSCERCEESQETREGSYFFRWKNANIELVGCREHITEVLNVLRTAQAQETP